MISSPAALPISGCASAPEVTLLTEGGVITPAARGNLSLSGTSGPFGTETPPFTKRKVEVELEFDGTSDRGLPRLTIAVAPFEGK